MKISKVQGDVGCKENILWTLINALCRHKQKCSNYENNGTKKPDIFKLCSFDKTHFMEFTLGIVMEYCMCTFFELMYICLWWQYYFPLKTKHFVFVIHLLWNLFGVHIIQDEAVLFRKRRSPASSKTYMI